jgi:hypothetical protein
MVNICQSNIKLFGMKQDYYQNRLQFRFDMSEVDFTS